MFNISVTNKVLIGVIFVLIVICGYLYYKSNDQKEFYQKELSNQKSTIIKLKEDSSTVYEKYATVDKNLNIMLAELNGRDNIIKRLIKEKSSLEKLVRDQNLKIVALINIKDTLSITINNLKTVQKNDSTYIASYKDAWISYNSLFNYKAMNPSNSYFSPPNIQISNDYTVLVTEKNGLTYKALVQNKNPYAGKGQNVEFGIDPKWADVPTFWEKYDFYIGTTLGIIAGIFVPR